MSENEEIMNETENETMAAEVEAVETVETEAAEVEAADEVSAEEEAEVVEAAVDYDDEELMDKMQKAARLLRSRRFAISKEEEAKAERMANIERAIKLLDLKPKMEQKEMSDLLGMRLRELDGLMAEAEAADLVGRIDDAEGDMRKIVVFAAEDAADPRRQQFLRLRLHFDERFGGQLLRQKPEQKRQARLIEIVKNGGDVGGIHGAEDVAQRMILLLIEQHGQGFLQGKIVFCHVLFLLKLMNRKVKTQRRHINRRMTGAASTGRTKAAGARADFGLRMCRYYFLRPFCFPPFLVRYVAAWCCFASRPNIYFMKLPGVCQSKTQEKSLKTARMKEAVGIRVRMC